MMQSKNSVSDEVLFKSLKDGNDIALKLIYDRYWKKMYLYAYNILEDSFICEDIIQEIFISFWEKAPKIDIQNIKAYLFQALKYKIANTFRDRKYSAFQEKIIAEIPSENNIKDILDYQDLEKQVKETLEKLPKKCRNVFYLSKIENYNNQEIAKELNISIRTVETHISNGLKHFRVHLSNGVLQLIIILILF
ncbi:RNA polymerase sigma factor [Joostella atrarenae]|nr:RNA polymerase sigma-70 factor [Joostella atrarenae]